MLIDVCIFLPSPAEATADTTLAGYPAQHWPLLPVRIMTLARSCKVSRDTVYSFQFILQCFSFYFSIEFRGGGAHNVHMESLVRGKRVRM